MTIAREHATAALLDDGRVLVAASRGSQSQHVATVRASDVVCTLSARRSRVLHATGRGMSLGVEGSQPAVPSTGDEQLCCDGAEHVVLLCRVAGR
jgi:hypothetical protein